MRQIHLGSRLSTFPVSGIGRQLYALKDLIECDYYEHEQERGKVNCASLGECLAYRHQ